MNITIPMSGRGQRFKEAGFKQPKPMIDVNGRPMIEVALRSLYYGMFDKYIFLCLEEFLKEYEKDFINILEGMQTVVYEIIPVKSVTEGAACTVLLSKDLINNDTPLVISDCDHATLDVQYLQYGVHYFAKKKADGGIFTFVANHPKWSYVRLNDNNEVIEVKEKEVVSNFANTGTFYFAKGSDFVNAAERMINQNIRTNNEFYVSNVYNQMILDGKKILPYFTNEMVALGTPQDLKLYLDGIK